MTDVLPITSHGIPFSVRLVRTGDRYGRDMCLVHEDAVPMIEFYDARRTGPGFDPGLGQFISRYCATTLTAASPTSQRNLDHGLLLDPGSPHWWVDGPEMQAVITWARARIEDARPAGNA